MEHKRVLYSRKLTIFSYLAPDNSECYTDPLGQDYRGSVAVTSSGLTCQRWTSQTPHEHVRTEERYPGKGLGDHNYCRNPDEEPGGAWCYTVNPEIRWQYCDIGNPRESCETGRSENI